MDFGYTESQTAVSQLARRIFKEARGDTWRALADAGLLATAIPETHGGADGGLLDLCALLVEAGGAACQEPLWATLAAAALPIAAFGTSAQHRRWLPAVATGDAVLSAALEPAGAIRAVANGAGWKLTGAADAVPALARAARVLVPATLDGREGARTGLFLLDPAAPGVTRREQTMTTGERRHRLELVDARVPADELLGDRLDAGEALAWTTDRATVALCALELGVCQRVLGMIASYTAERQQFGRPIATFQAVSHRAADAYIDTEAIRLSTWQAAWRLSEGLPADDAVSIAKIWAAEGGHRVVAAAQHLHGGIGFDLDYPLGQYYLLSKQLELALGGGARHVAALGARFARD